METRKNTTAGVLFWTPAPVHTSPTSSVISEDVWEDEDEEQAERNNDFVSQMDENGIIGLSETLEDAELEDSWADSDAECNPNHAGSLAPEEADHSGHERDTPEELSYNLSEHLSFTQSPGEDVQILSGFEDLMGSLKARTVDAKECPISQPASPVTASTFPHLLHFTAEEMAAAPGIDAETFPDMSFTESLPESHRSHISLKSSPRPPEVKLRASLQPAAMFSEEVTSSHCSGVTKGPTPSPRKLRQLSPEATYSKTCSHSIAKSLKFKHPTASPDREQSTPRAAEVDESRKGPLSYRIPDFSKVEPRVHFPKGGYNPPKSRRSSKRESLSPEPPLVFKSPADIVKEVLLNTTDEPAASSDSYKPPTSGPNSTVPQEFRCRQQATTLLDQLQEDYHRLLTKYAEAENTIDRMRLEAKVNLYSDPPKPGHLVQSGPNRDTSKFTMLDFPQAQRAEINSARLHPNGHSSKRSPSACLSTRSPDPHVGQQLAKVLYNQANKFHQQLQTFEDLLKSKRLKPFEQMKGVSQLAEGLDSLERGYLLARDEYKLLQQRGADFGHFDPDRELEGLVFQCGLRMEELKERVEQMQQEQPTCEAPPSPPPHPTPSSVPSDGGETLSHPQSPPVPLLVDPGDAAAVEVSSASEESDEEEESVYLKPLNGKHRHAEHGWMDYYQSFKELPKLLDHSQKEGALLFAALRSNMQPGDEEEERQGTGNQETSAARKSKSDQQDSPAVRTNKQQSSRSSPLSRSASSQFNTLPAHPPSSRRRLEVGKSHSSSLSSLGEITALERRNSKLLTGSSRVLSQDGIISPETDSGFVCSESSRLTPAAAPSPLHQRAPESVSVLQEELPQIGLVSAPAPASPPSHSRMVIYPRKSPRLSHDQQKRSRQGQSRRTFSCSPQRCVRQMEQTTADSGTSDFGLESDSSHTVSGDRRDDQYTQSINSLHNSSPSSSLAAAQYHHDDSLRALSSSQVANRNDAIQTLQAEVTRLKERLESCLRNKKPLSSVRAAPSTRTTSSPRIRSGERWGEVSRERRDRQMVNEEYTLRRTTRKRPPSAHKQKPQSDICSEPSTLQPQVSRCTQTSTVAPDSSCSHTHSVFCRTQPNADLPEQIVCTPLVSVFACVLQGSILVCLHKGVKQQMNLTAEGVDLLFVLSVCHMVTEGDLKGQLMATEGRDIPQAVLTVLSVDAMNPTEAMSQYQQHTVLQSLYSDSTTHTSCQPAESPDRVERSRYFAAAAPPALLQCMPVCPPPLLLYSSPLYVSPSNNPGTSSEVRGRGEMRGRTRRSLSVDKQRSMDTSLKRAIRAARHMKHTSGHMARSLATGLHYHELLTQPCSN